jgi:murein DD-endopeptidase MepM/ murein hydrolase activator NlpD
MPVFAIGNGIVVLAGDVRMGWGNVVIVRHAYVERGGICYIDSLYGHLNDVAVRVGQAVERGQKVGTIGNDHGRYDAHLHFEIHRNLTIGINHSGFSGDFSNYFDPTQFIAAHRRLSTGPGAVNVAMNTFTLPGGGAQPSGGVLRFPGTRSQEPRVRVIARKGTFKVNRYEDVDLSR